MPFQSEKQRRYLWANEPEIARDWTDEYGSRIHKEDGGIMRVPFQGGGNYLQNTAAQNMFGKMYHTLNPFEKFQINEAIETYGANEPGITASTGGGGGGGGAGGDYIDPATESGLEYLDQFKSNIPSDWPSQRKKGFSEYEFFDEYLRDNPQLYEGIAQNLGRGIDKTKDTLGNIYQGGKRRGIQGLNMLGAGYQLAKGAFPLSLLFNPGSAFSNLRRNHPTQNAYEQARRNRQVQGRIDYMKQRREAGDDYSKINLANLLEQTGQQDDWKPPAPPVPPTYYAPSPEQHGGGDRHGGGGQHHAHQQTRSDDSWRSDPFAQGGRVNFSEGGLAGLWHKR